jgi:hypothetical protein
MSFSLIGSDILQIIKISGVTHLMLEEEEEEGRGGG